MPKPDDWEETTHTTDTDHVSDKISVSTQPPKPCLTVLTGSATGQIFKVKLGEIVIGRGAGAEVRLVDEGISRLHARVRHDNGRAWLEDMGSRNGTFVNGVRLGAPTELREGDKIQVGSSTVLRFGFQDDLDESFHENLVSSALRDGLTKLFNKRYLMDRLDSELKFALRHQTTLSLLLLDLDHFKKINDTRGHLAGDMVLTTVAAGALGRVEGAVGGCVEGVGVCFAPPGAGNPAGDRHRRRIALEPAASTAERLRKLVESTKIALDGGKELRATVSIGLANFPSTPCKTLEELVETADKALYRAKNAGRNRVAR